MNSTTASRKKAVQVIDASSALQQSDVNHGLHRKRKLTEYSQTSHQRQDTAEPQLASLSSLTKEVHELRVEAMTKRTRRQHEEEKLKAIGGIIKTPQIPVKMRMGIADAKVKRAGKRYDRLKELGVATGIDPRKQRALELKSRERKAEPRGMKLHKIGRMHNDGTLSIGKGAIRKTQDTLRKSRSGGAKLTKIFK